MLQLSTQESTSRSQSQSLAISFPHVQRTNAPVKTLYKSIGIIYHHHMYIYHFHYYFWYIYIYIIYIIFVSSCSLLFHTMWLCMGIWVYHEQTRKQETVPRVPPPHLPSPSFLPPAALPAIFAARARRRPRWGCCEPCVARWRRYLHQGSLYAV